ncbi:helix-turn-helix domain-containing protein [Frigoribacterium sp. 2-23]|uniref:helix-turn-helix domain-containing protein n=1 Tax=Frigoribacterium sp. 2-23 TaxID=3415006 RepID=UPI003C7044A5
MTRTRVDYDWHLRRIMHEHDLHKTTDLAPLLEERGIRLSPAQIYRLVAEKPERLSLRTLAALCDIFECQPGDLVEPRSEAHMQRRVSGDTGPSPLPVIAPVRARIIDLGS